MRTLPLLSGLLFALLPATVFTDQPATETVPIREIHVVVAESPGHPLPGVTVSVLGVHGRERSDSRSLIEGGRLRITDANGRAIFTSLQEGDYYIRFELSGFLTETLGPLPIGKACVRLPELRVLLSAWVSTCY